MKNKKSYPTGMMNMSFDGKKVKPMMPEKEMKKQMKKMPKKKMMDY